MKTIYSVEFTVANPRPDDPDDFGRTDLAYYTLDGNALTMTSSTGEPERDADGVRVTRQLDDVAQAKEVAHRLGRQRYFASDLGKRSTGFFRPLQWRKNDGIY